MAKHQQHTTEILEQLAESFRYEATMFLHAARREAELRPRNRDAELWRDYNMALEVFLLHYRVLTQFLCPPPVEEKRQDSDVYAFEYVVRERRRDYDPDKRLAARLTPINKRLAHGTDHRKDKDVLFPCDLMKLELGQAYGAWLTDAAQRWNRSLFADTEIEDWVASSRGPVRLSLGSVSGTTTVSPSQVTIGKGGS